MKETTDLYLNPLNKIKELQSGHSKISYICYEKFKPQEYLKTHMLNNHEVSLLFSLRSKTAREFKANFPCNQEQLCRMGCKSPDTQEHCINCEKLTFANTNKNDIEYNDIFSSDITKQVAVTKLFTSLLVRREDAINPIID